MKLSPNCYLSTTVNVGCSLEGGGGEIIGASAVVTEVRITYVMGFPVVVVVMESDSDNFEGLFGRNMVV
jgi:hypothetical protein